MLHMDTQMDNLAMEAHKEEVYKNHGGFGSDYTEDFDGIHHLGNNTILFSFHLSFHNLGVTHFHL